MVLAAKSPRAAKNRVGVKSDAHYTAGYPTIYRQAYLRTFEQGHSPFNGAIINLISHSVSGVPVYPIETHLSRQVGFGSTLADLPA